MKSLFVVTMMCLLAFATIGWCADGFDCKDYVEAPRFEVWADKVFPDGSGGGDFPHLKCVGVRAWQGYVQNCPNSSQSLEALMAYATAVMEKDGWKLVSHFKEEGLCVGSDMYCTRNGWLCFTKSAYLEIMPKKENQ